jgi:hypothetical protein
MRDIPTPAEIRQLTDNDNPDIVWAKAIDIVRRISPAYDFTFVLTTFTDVLRMFRGEYPGYCAIKTPYHDLHHTLDVFLCSVRIMHGVHLSGTPLKDSEITCVMLATLLHDIGYAQRIDEEYGTGAQYTLTHVARGIEFMHQYLPENNLPPDFAVPVECLVNSTNPGLSFDDIKFPDERTRLLAQIVGSADIVGQMADRTYLEKLMFLYLEFKEARFGNYESIHDLLCKTKDFYEVTKNKKLDGTYDGMYKKLIFHFKDYLGIDNNYYTESIERNIAYLSKVISLNEADFHIMLKRAGIVEKSKHIVSPGVFT